MIRGASLPLGLFFSGAAALLYESSWSRMLHRVFGVSDLAVATVLAAFFLGLGLGGALGGRLAARIARPALAYAAIEIAVALLAIGSIALVPEIRTGYEWVASGASFGELTLARWGFASLVLLPPTILMGATIPVLARVTSSGTGGWSSAVTALYVANTVGAIAGAGLAGFWSIPELGVRASVLLAALGSGIAAVIVGGAHLRDRLEPAPAAATPAAPAHARRTIHLATILAFLSGATALAGEVLWTRVLRVIVHGTTTAFAAMLVNYLAGIAIGAWLAPKIARRLGARRAFGAIQLGVAVAFTIAIVCAPRLPQLVPLMRGEPGTVPHEPAVLLAISWLLLGPLSILTGTGLPLAWAIVEEAATEASRGAGRLLASNTIGGLLGSLGAAFLMVPAIGTEASLIVIVAACAISAVIALRSAAETLAAKLIALSAPAAWIALVLVVRPSLDLPFLLAAGEAPLEALIAGPGEGWRRSLVFLREGRNTTVTVRRGPGGLSLQNDGRPESGMGLGVIGFGPELILLGALPGLFAEERERALVVGLGGGHTTALALAAGFRSVHAVELEPGVVEAARLLYEARGRPFPLDDERATLTIDDARSQLALAEPASLDAVISQPSHPWLAGSAALYTREFFEEVARSLRPGGVFGLWVNLFRTDLAALRSVLATLGAVFPSIQAFVESSSLVLIASESPFDWTRASERMGADALARYLEPSGLSEIAAIASALELDEAAARALGEGGEPITDDRPVIEFRLARQRHHASLPVSALDRVLADTPWAAPGASVLASAAAGDVIERRIERIAPRRLALERVARSLEAGALEPSRLAELRGAIAEARGDASGALAAYAEAGTPAAALAEDRLRLADRALEALIARARARAARPSGVAPLIEAVIARARPEDLAFALEVADRGPILAEPERPLVASAQAYARHGCEGLRAAPELDAASRASAPLARLAQRCALLAGDEPRALEMEQRAWRRRTVEANELTARGREALQGGNGGLAWMLLDRALAVYPSSSGAAAALAELHRRDGRPELARAVLVRAWAASEGLPEARARIAQSADALGLDLRQEGVAIEQDVSSTAPSTPMQRSP